MAAKHGAQSPYNRSRKKKHAEGRRWIRSAIRIIVCLFLLFLMGYACLYYNGYIDRLPVFPDGLGSGWGSSIEPESDWYPENAQEAYAVINDNEPLLTEEDDARLRKLRNQECISPEVQYSALDPLGRCGPAEAILGPELLPEKERSDTLYTVTPAGWQTYQYEDLITDRYLYNRCHLIGYLLCGEEVNEKNLITGTRYLNVNGMLPFERMIASYIRKSGAHVWYRVTPVYEGNNLLAYGVLMEALSVEDGGASICFSVYCYNVQPGITVRYADGMSSRDGTIPAEQLIVPVNRGSYPTEYFETRFEIPNQNDSVIQ